jgi:hypothetical protein
MDLSNLPFTYYAEAVPVRTCAPAGLSSESEPDFWGAYFCTWLNC